MLTAESLLCLFSEHREKTYFVHAFIALAVSLTSFTASMHKLAIMFAANKISQTQYSNTNATIDTEGRHF